MYFLIKLETQFSSAVTLATQEVEAEFVSRMDHGQATSLVQVTLFAKKFWITHAQNKFAQLAKLVLWYSQCFQKKSKSTLKFLLNGTTPRNPVGEQQCLMWIKLRSILTSCLFMIYLFISENEWMNECLDPGSFQNGQRSPSNGPYCSGEEIVYTCDDLYQLQGDSVIQCENRQFNKPVPSCVPETLGKLSIPSSKLTVLFHSKVKGRKYSSKIVIYLFVVQQVIVLTLDQWKMGTNPLLLVHFIMVTKYGSGVMMGTNWKVAPQLSV